MPVRLHLTHIPELDTLVALEYRSRRGAWRRRFRDCGWVGRVVLALVAGRAASVEAGQDGGRPRAAGGIEKDCGHDASLRFGGSEARAHPRVPALVRRRPAWESKSDGALLLRHHEMQRSFVSLPPTSRAAGFGSRAP
jgi:hypothetical protein